MSIKWKIYDNEKTWVENSPEDINIVETIEGEDDHEKTYVIQGRIRNFALIRKKDDNYTWKPYEIQFSRGVYYVTKWEKVKEND